MFDPPTSYQGHVIYDYWAKGSNLINHLLGILIRFREFPIPVLADIRKMYHSVHMTELEHHVHRFLWREIDTSHIPDEYIYGACEQSR